MSAAAPGALKQLLSRVKDRTKRSLATFDISLAHGGRLLLGPFRRARATRAVRQRSLLHGDAHDDLRAGAGGVLQLLHRHGHAHRPTAVGRRLRAPRLERSGVTKWRTPHLRASGESGARVIVGRVCEHDWQPWRRLSRTEREHSFDSIVYHHIRNVFGQRDDDMRVFPMRSSTHLLGSGFFPYCVKKKTHGSIPSCTPSYH
jgi:hypothetical protein